MSPDRQSVPAHLRVRPSEARRRILEQHDELRARLRALDGTARRVLEGDIRSRVELHDLARSFLRDLEEHMRFEERVLAPALADADPWGAERVSRLMADHERQREVLRAWAHDLTESGIAPVEFALLARGVVVWVTEDIETEEREHLDAGLLRDDVIDPTV